MKRFLLAAALLFCSCAHAASTDSAQIWTYKYLVATSWTERELAPVTEHIIESPWLNSRSLVDVVAETLLARVDDAAFPVQNKIRLIRVLDKRGGPRYHPLLRRVLESSEQDAVRNAAEGALPRKATKAVETYVPGTIDLRAIVAEVDASALAAKPTTAQGERLAKFEGGSIEDLFRWAGRPHQVVSGQTRVSDGILVHVKFQRLSFFYRGLGRVVFGYRPKYDEWEFQSVVADPLAFEEEFHYRERAGELGLPDAATLEMIQLVSGYTSAMKLAVQRRYKQAASPIEFLDTAAEVLVRHHKDAESPADFDAYAWICRLLREHGGVRYSAVLERVATETDDLKLARFARSPFVKTTGVSTDPYTAGTVDLDAQRAKYPSLYPDSTYTSGQL